MFGFLKRLFGFGTPKWLQAQRTQVELYLEREGLRDGLVPEPVWTLEPYVALWQFEKGWAMTDPIITLHELDEHGLIASTRDAARVFGRRFRDAALGAADDSPDVAEALEVRASALLGLAIKDTNWGKSPTMYKHTRQVIENALANCQALAEGDSQIRNRIRLVVNEVEAPGGSFHGLYFFLDFRHGEPIPPTYDALARLLMVFETRFAPLVSWRVQYALVLFGVNFGEPTRELQVEREADEMLRRTPKLARMLDKYSDDGKFSLAMHLVDDKDIPFTAHICTANRPADKAYNAEEKYFNIQEHAFQLSLEKSDAVSLRLLAASISKKNIRNARKAFAK